MQDFRKAVADKNSTSAKLAKNGVQRSGTKKSLAFMEKLIAKDVVHTRFNKHELVQLVNVFKCALQEETTDKPIITVSKPPL